MIPTYGRHCGVKMFGALNCATGKTLCNEEETGDAVAFLRFLHPVLDHYSSGKIVMILNNAHIHHATLIQPFLQENRNRLELMFLQPYSPQLNLMEGAWEWLKESVIHNVFFDTVPKIALAVQSILLYINERWPEVIDQLCIRM